MGILSRFEHKAENTIEGASSRSKHGIEPVKLAKRAYKEMQREKMVGVGQEYAPTLYNILVSTEDDRHMSAYYPSLVGEIETYLTGRAEAANLVLDCAPLVRFIVDDGLKSGRFDVIAESVSPAIIEDLRREEAQYYSSQKDNTPQGYEKHNDEKASSYDASAPQQVSGRAGGYAAVGLIPNPIDATLHPQYPANAYPGTGSFAPVQKMPDSQFAPNANFTPASATPPAAKISPQTGHDANTSAETENARADERTQLISSTTISNGAHASLVSYADGQRHPLVGRRIIVGRGSACNIIINDPSVSRRHAEILHNETGWLIRDTGSTNGTYVNGARAAQSHIYNGDILKLGNAELEFQEGR